MARIMRRGLVGEFESHEAIVFAARELVKAGYRRLDAFTPYPITELERLILRKRSPICWVVFPFGMAGAAGGYLVQWWTNAVDYPLNAGGRPAHAPPAFVPVVFEMGVLASALSALVLLALWSGLPALWQPVFEVPGIERASIDRFFMAVLAEDPAFDREATAQKLRSLGALSVASVGLSESGAASGEVTS